MYPLKTPEEDLVRDLTTSWTHYNLPTFVDYDVFLGCDMDAVVLANYFHQHDLFAIKALNAGKPIFGKLSPRRRGVRLTDGTETRDEPRSSRAACVLDAPANLSSKRKESYADSCFK